MLEESIQDQPIAFFVGIDPMQHICGIGFKPFDVFGVAPPWHNSEARRDIAVKARHVRTKFNHGRITKQRKVIQDCIVLTESHVMGQTWSG